MLIVLARWVTNRPRVSLLIAIALTGVAVALGTPLSSQLTGGSQDFETPGSSSMHASATIERASRCPGRRRSTGDGADPARPSASASRALVRQVAALIGQSPDVLATQTVYSTGAAWMLSRDGRATYVLAQLHRDSQPKHTLNDVEHRLRGITGVAVGGSPAADTQVVQTVEKDLTRAELLVFPVLFLLSLWIFRSLIASALPVVMGALNIMVTFLVLRGVNEVVHLSIFALNLVTALGLGLAIDYSLLLVSRYRAELAAGATVQAALQRTVGTAGRTIVFSAATVSASLAALLVFQQRFLYSMAIGGAVVTHARRRFRSGGATRAAPDTRTSPGHPRAQALAARTRTARQSGWLVVPAGTPCGAPGHRHCAHRRGDPRRTGLIRPRGPDSRTSQPASCRTRRPRGRSTTSCGLTS